MLYCFNRPSTEDRTAEKLVASCRLEETKASTVLRAWELAYETLISTKSIMRNEDIL